MKIQSKDFYSFIIERESIRLRKAAGLPAPWTEDKILQEYKFTNVRRKHDKTTEKLVEMLYSKKGQTAPLEVILLNCAISRYFGTWEFAEAIGWQDKFEPKFLIKIARTRLDKKARVFTGAYLITNVGIPGPKEEVVVNVFLKNLWEARKDICKIAKETNSWEQTASRLRQIQGFGGTGFMAKETLLDTMHCAFWENGLPSDYWNWTPIGPGARRGINRLLGKSVDAIMAEEEMLEIILMLTEQQELYWPKDWGKLSPTDLQFQLCEYDKHSRVKAGEGRPRSKYNGKAK